jgi:murein DD-endopeptidase MepM/ murein hydrolase activator NlpD
MVAAVCPRCRGVVALHEGRPVVTEAGAVELWHLACHHVRDVPIVAELERIDSAPIVVVAPRRRWPSRWAVGAAATGIVAIAVVQWAWAAPPPAPSALASVSITTHEPIAAREVVAVRESVPPRPTADENRMQARYPIPKVGEAYLDESFPSLRGWIHPVTASDELMPEGMARWFGAARVGVERAECGEGHCGVDLDGPRGRPLVSVASGQIIRVERSENGADGRSGRYVRIQHEDGTLTSYMHMDDVADEMQVGAMVKQGQYVGTLGATATYSSPPHLHFSLEIPNMMSNRKDYTSTHYVDPAPFLVRARIVPAMNRREPKPAS